MLFTKDFWIDTLERAIRTACQAALSAGVIGGVGLFEVDWLNVCGIALVAAIASVLTSVASSGKTDSISPASGSSPHVRGARVGAHGPVA